jgi:hypothetical protein
MANVHEGSEFLALTVREGGEWRVGGRVVKCVCNVWMPASIMSVEEALGMPTYVGSQVTVSVMGTARVLCIQTE